MIVVLKCLLMLPMQRSGIGTNCRQKGKLVQAQEGPIQGVRGRYWGLWCSFLKNRSQIVVLSL